MVASSDSEGFLSAADKTCAATGILLHRLRWRLASVCAGWLRPPRLSGLLAAGSRYPLLADSGFTKVQVRCRLTARWLTFNRATKMRAEGLRLLASISIWAP